MPFVDVIEAAGGGRAFMNLGAHPLFLSQRDTLLNDSIQGGDNQVRFSHLNPGISFFPFIFFFHGAGSRGHDTRGQHGYPSSIHATAQCTAAHGCHYAQRRSHS